MIKTDVIEKCHEGKLAHWDRPNSDFKGRFKILCVGEEYFFARDEEAAKGKEFCMRRQGNWVVEDAQG